MERSELLAYVWTFWCLADRASGRSLIETKIKKSRRVPDAADALTRAIENTLLEKDHGRRVQKIKDLILKQRDAVSPETGLAVERLLTAGAFPEQMPTDDPRAACGYVTANCALWIRPNSEELIELLDGVAANPSTLFYEDKTFASKIHRFSETERCREWRGDELNPLRVLSRDEKRVLSLISPSFDARFRGFVVVGNDPELDRGVIWIGVRDPVQVENLSYRERAWRLRRPLSFVTSFETSTAVPWFELPDSLPLTPLLVRDVMRSLGVNAGTEPLGTESDDAMRFVDDGTRVFAVSALGREAAARAVFQRSRTLTSSVVWLLDREGLGRTIAAEPSLWSRYIAPAAGFVVVRDSEDARKYLIGDDPRIFDDTKSALNDLISQAANCLERAVQRLIEDDELSDDAILADFEREYGELLFAMDPTRRQGTDEWDWLVDNDKPLETSAMDMTSHLASQRPSYLEKTSIHTYLEKEFPDLRENLWSHVARPRLARLLPIDPNLRLGELIGAFDEGLNLRVVGRTGDGKSAALLGLLTDQFADSLKVIVSPLFEGTISSSTAQALTGMIAACSSQRFVVVIDRLEQQVGVAPHDTLLYQILLLKDRIIREGRVPFTIIVSHWPRDAAFAETYSAILRRWSFSDWALDEPHPEYLRGVARHVISSLHLPQGTSAAIVEEAIASNATPRALTERLAHQGNWYVPYSDSQFWDEAFTGLIAAKRESDASLLLQAICAFRTYGLAPQRSVLRTFVCEWLHRETEAFDRALAVLREHGWITRTADGEFVADEAQLEAVAGRNHPLERQLQDAVLDGAISLAPDKLRAVLADGAQCAESERMLRFLTVLAAIDPGGSEQYAREAARAGIVAVEHETLGALIDQHGYARLAFAHHYATTGQLSALLRVLPDITIGVGEATALIATFLDSSDEAARAEEALKYVRGGSASLYELELLASALNTESRVQRTTTTELCGLVTRELARVRAETYATSDREVEDGLDE